MRVRRKLPCPQVRGQKKHPLAAPLAFEKILVTIQNEGFFDIFPRVAGYARKLCRHPAEAAHHSTQRVSPLCACPLRKCKIQIKFRGLAKLRCQLKQYARNASAHCSRQRTRQSASRLEHNPHDCVCQPFLHRWTLFTSGLVSTSPETQFTSRLVSISPETRC